jgi:hypothetical protein
MGASYLAGLRFLIPFLSKFTSCHAHYLNVNAVGNLHTYTGHESFSISMVINTVVSEINGMIFNLTDNGILPKIMDEKL